MTRIVRVGPGSIGDLRGVLDEAGISSALLVTTERGATAVAARGLPVAGVFDGVRPHVPVETVAAAADRALELEVDGLVGLGGGAAIDTAKAVVARLREGRLVTIGYKVVAVPTTYAGAEWTPYFGLLLGPGRKGGGLDEHARPVAAVYDAELTLDLPVDATVGTTMNGLAHCAEALYHPATTDEACVRADLGAAAIAEALPQVAAEPSRLASRTLLLEGAMHAALALADSGLCLAHAMAQGLGGRFGLEQGTMNALCLPAALRFNQPAVPGAVARLGRALGGDAVTRCVELAAHGGFPKRLRDHGVPQEELPAVAAAIAARPGARANPRAATDEDVEGLLREIW